MGVVRDSAFGEQALQLRGRLGSHALRKVIHALPVFRAQSCKTDVQVGLIVFQPAQQPLCFRDSFFQANHAKCGSPHLYSAIAGAGDKLQAGCGAGLDQNKLRQGGVRLQLCRHLFLQPVREPLFKLVLRALRHLNELNSGVTGPVAPSYEAFQF